MMLCFVNISQGKCAWCGKPTFAASSLILWTKTKVLVHVKAGTDSFVGNSVNVLKSEVPIISN